MKQVRSIGILLRADRIAVAILIAAVIVVAAVVAIGSDCRGADCCCSRGACHRAAISIAASRNSISTAGNAVAAATNRSAADANCSAAGDSSVKAPTSVTAAAAPTCERIIRHEAGPDQNDCCQCSEGISKHGLFSSPACGSQQCEAHSDPHPGTIFDDEPIEA
jgi:hypothetical protein